MIERNLIEEIPTLYTEHRQIVLDLDKWNKPKHYWHAIVWLQAKLGKGEYPDETIEKDIKICEKALASICSEFSRMFADEGHGFDRTYRIWRTNQKGQPDQLHYYDSGAIPPRLFCRKEDGKGTQPEESEELIEVWTEVLEWIETPAARGSTLDLNELRARAESIIDSCEKEIEAYEKLQRAQRQLERQKAGYEKLLWQKETSDWMQVTVNSGKMAKWCKEYGLVKMQAYMDAVLGGKVKQADYWKEFAKADGDLEILEAVLLTLSPADSATITKLRQVIKDQQWKPYGSA